MFAIVSVDIFYWNGNRKKASISLSMQSETERGAQLTNTEFHQYKNIQKKINYECYLNVHSFVFIDTIRSSAPGDLERENSENGLRNIFKVSIGLNR